MKFLTKRDDENKSRSGLISQLRIPPRKKTEDCEVSLHIRHQAKQQWEVRKRRCEPTSPLSSPGFCLNLALPLRIKDVPWSADTRAGKGMHWSRNRLATRSKRGPIGDATGAECFPLFLLIFKSKPGFNDSRETIKPQWVCSPFVIQVWSSGAKHKHAGRQVNDATHQRKWM